MNPHDPFIKDLLKEIEDIDHLDERALWEITNKIYGYYAKEAFKGEVKWSNRLKTSGANIKYDIQKDEASIHINRHYVNKFGKEEMIEILKHELTHYYLFKHKNFHHHHGKVFQKILNEIFHCARLHAKWNEDVYRYAYICQNCGTIHKRVRKINQRIYCSKCVKANGGQLKKEFRMLLKTT